MNLNPKQVAEQYYLALCAILLAGNETQMCNEEFVIEQKDIVTDIYLIENISFSQN